MKKIDDADGSRVVKIKKCPSCSHKNVSFSSHCEECNTDIVNEKIYTIPLPPTDSVSEYRARRFLISSVFLIVFVIVMGVLLLISHFV